jgi:hypothetical protein
MTIKGTALIMSKKAAHMTKEQKRQEKLFTTDFEEQTKKMAKLKNIMENGKWRKWSTYKARRQYKLYGQTTHSDVMSDTKDIITALQTAITS